MTFRIFCSKINWVYYAELSKYLQLERAEKMNFIERLNNKNNLADYDYQNEVIAVLKKHYAYGYRLESSIEMKRFRRFALVDGISLPEDDEQLKVEILNAGFLIKDKIYVMGNKTVSDLKEIIQAIVVDGFSILFFEPIIERYSKCMEENHITSSDMLKEILYYNKKEIFTDSDKVYFAKNFLSTEGKWTENEAVTNELRRIWGDVRIHSIDELEGELPYIPSNYIKRYVSVNPDFVWVSEEVYLLLDRFTINTDEEKSIYNFVSESCELNGFASINDVPLGNIDVENYEISITGLYTAIYNKVLSKDFFLNGKILTKEKNNLDVIMLVRQYIENKDECTFTEAKDKVIELTGSNYRYVAYKALYESMIRVDKNKYVAEQYVNFDIDIIDELLESIIKDRFVSIKEVTTFALFPICGQAWNHYLLESFCYRYSKKYSLFLMGFNDRNVGIIAERGVTLNYKDMLVIAATRAKIELTTEAVGNFFFDTGYMGKRKFAWLESVIEKAVAIRKEE